MPKPITEKQKQEAAQKSITKWHNIAYKHGKDHGPTDCGYCQLYNSEDMPLYSEICDGCPVYEATGEPFCRKTPYHDWCEKQTGGMALSEKAKKAAEEELHFLIYLQPPGERIVVNDEWEYSWHWGTK